MTDSDLVAFLKARYDEEEAQALALRSEDWGDRPWTVEDCAEHDCPCIVYQGEYKPFTEAQVPLIQYIADGEAPEYAAWIARHDPARVLREVEAKRKIVRRCMAGMDELDVYPNGLLTPRALLSRQTLMDLAAVYSDHPDYWPAAAGKDGER